MVKLITVTGSNVHEGQIKRLYTASCKCGNKIVRAEKETSLSSYIEKEKYSCKECNSVLKLTGQKFFKGDILIDDETAMKEIDSFSEEASQNSIPDGIKLSDEISQEQPSNPISDLIKTGPRGITNQGMIPAIKENIADEAKLQMLFDTYPEIFKSSAKYLSDKMKVKVEKLIKTKDIDFKLKYKEGTVVSINNVNGLIKDIKNKVTNTQMLPAIKENINKPENIKALYEAYPQIFTSSIKYLSAKVRTEVEKVIQPAKEEKTDGMQV